jgi:ParB family chromosome partitioning protein
MISAGHAKVLLSVADEKTRAEFAKRVLRDGVSVRMLEELIVGRKGARKKKAALSNDMRSIEEAIQERLGTKVRIRHGKKRGQINIEYYSNEDLSRILKVLGCGIM